jgi:hypothetical protein
MNTNALLIVVTAVAAAVYFTQTRRGSKFLTSKAANVMAFTTPLPASEAFKVALSWAAASSYKIDEIDEKGLRLLLSEDTTALNWGRFYPAFLSSSSAGTIVEVGVHSKWLFTGRVAARAQERCFNSLKAALLGAQRI